MTIKLTNINHEFSDLIKSPIHLYIYSTDCSFRIFSVTEGALNGYLAVFIHKNIPYMINDILGFEEYFVIRHNAFFENLKIELADYIEYDISTIEELINL